MLIKSTHLYTVRGKGLNLVKNYKVGVIFRRTNYLSVHKKIQFSNRFS